MKDSKSSDTILKRLQAADFHGVDTQVKEYLQPLLGDSGDVSSVSAKERLVRAKMALHYLHAYCSRFDAISAEDVSGAVSAIVNCAECSQSVLGKSSDVLYVTKLLASCTSKAAKAMRVEPAGPLANYLLQHLLRSGLPPSAESAEQSNIAACYLWFCCTNSDKQSSKDLPAVDPNQQDVVVLNCSFASLKLLLLGGKDLHLLPKNLLLTLKNCKKKSSWKLMTDGVQTMMDLFLSYLQASDASTLTPDLRFALACCMTRTCVVYVKFVLGCGNVAAAEDAISVLKIALDAKALRSSVAPVDLKGLRLVVGLLQPMTKSSGGGTLSKSDTRSCCLDDINRALNGFKSHVNEISPSTILTIVAAVDCALSILIEDPKTDVVSDACFLATLAVCDFRFLLSELALRCCSPSEADGGVAEQLESLEVDARMWKLEITSTRLMKDVYDADLTDMVVRDFVSHQNFLNSRCGNDGQLPPSEHYRLGYLAFRVGCSFYGHARYNVTVSLLRVSVNQFNSYMATEEGRSNVAKSCRSFQISKVYEILYDSLKKLDQLQDAMSAIVAFWMADCHHADWVFAAWQRVMCRCAVISNGSNGNSIRSFASSLGSQLASSGKQDFDAVAMLKKELEALRKSRLPPFAYHLAVLNELISLSSDTCVKASALLEKAHLLHSNRKDSEDGRSPVDLCNDIISMVGLSGDHDALAVDLLARTNLSLYILRAPDHLDKLIESSSRTITNVTKRRSAEFSHLTKPLVRDDEDDSEIFTVCSQLAAEADLLAPVHQALEHWEKCFLPNNDEQRSSAFWERPVDTATSVDYIEVLVAVYKLMQSPQLARALHLLSHVAQSVGDLRRRLVAQTDTAALYNSLQQPIIADRCIADAKSWISSTECGLKFPRQYLEFLTIESETLLLLHKVSESSAVLQTAFKLCRWALKPTSLDLLVAESMLWLTEAKVRSMQLVESSTSGGISVAPKLRDVPDTPLELAVASARHIAGILQYLFGDRKMESSRKSDEDSLAEKWRLLSILCDSMFYTGLCYVEAGDLRGAKSHLLQGLRFCEAFRLRKRFSEIHIALAMLCTSAGQFTDSYVHTSLVMSILDVNAPRCTRITLPAKLTQSKRSTFPDIAVLITSTSSSTSSTAFSDADPEETTDFIRSRAAAVDYQSAVVDVCGSPTATERMTVKIPPTWKHSAKCLCVLCVDPALERIYLACHVTEAVNRLYQGQTADADKMLSAVLKQSDRLSVNAAKLGVEFDTMLESDGEIMVDYRPDSVYQQLFDVVRLYQCEVALLRNDTKRFSKCLNDSQQLLSCGDHLCQAGLFYIGALSNLRWQSTANLLPKIEISDVDILCANIGRLNVADVSTPIKVTPTAAESADAVTKEPAKGRGRSRKPTSDIPVLSVAAAPIKKRPVGGRLAAGKKQPGHSVMSLLTDDVFEIAEISPSNLDSLVQAFHILRFNPTTPLYRDVCGALATELLQVGGVSTSTDSWSVAFYLSESQAVTFRHACSLNNVRKVRKLDAKDLAIVRSSNGAECSSYRTRLLDMRRNMTFGRSPDDLQQMIRGLPSDLIVCQLSVVKPSVQSIGRLYLTRFNSDSPPLTVCLAGHETVEGQKLMMEFEAVMAENRNSMLITERSEWWSRRRGLDKQLGELLVEIEKQFLGCWRGAVIGKLSLAADRTKLSRAATNFAAKFKHINFHEQILERLLDGGHLMSDRDLVCGLQFAAGAVGSTSGAKSMLDKQACQQLLKVLKPVLKSLNLEKSPRGAVTLVLDRLIQQLPWENIPCLSMQHVTRVPSLHFLYAHWRSLNDDPTSVLNAGVRRQNVFYIVNPDSNLPNTQQTFQSWFESEPGWKGITGRTPSTDEMTSGISGCDLFLYCGHGTGNMYLAEEALQQLPCRAAVMLMGCSSGRLVAHGSLDASGTMLHYFLAGAACIIGNLWDVTDRDIDRFQESTLRRWFDETSATAAAGSTVPSDLLHAMQEARQACKLRYLTGAAPVMYGFPVNRAC